MTHTRDEIMAMSAEELRIAIAEAKGMPKDGVQCGHIGCRAHFTHPCEGCGRVAAHAPYWPTDISAAWELVEEIVEREYEIEVRHSVGILGYICTIETPTHRRPKVDYICISENTAPLAICRAWLMWKELK